MHIRIKPIKMPLIPASTGLKTKSLRSPSLETFSRITANNAKGGTTNTMSHTDSTLNSSISGRGSSVVTQQGSTGSEKVARRLPVEYEGYNVYKDDDSFSSQKYVEETPIKQASTGSAGSGLMERAAGTALNTIAAMGVLQGASALTDAIRGHFEKEVFERSFQKALAMNPKLRSYPEAELRQYFNLVVSASPTVAKNPLLAGNYLQYLLDYKGNVNFAGFKSLVDLEGQITKNKNESTPLLGITQKAIIENSTRSIWKGKDKD
jgi:hypothetical protein